jgi:hypothetical protein
MFLFKKELELAGISETRRQKLAEAFDLLHTAISQCDRENQKLFSDFCPHAVSTASTYASIEGLNLSLWGLTDEEEAIAANEFAAWVAEYNEYAETESRPSRNNVIDMGDYR